MVFLRATSLNFSLLAPKQLLLVKVTVDEIAGFTVTTIRNTFPGQLPVVGVTL
jgi:hypothetical protein